MQWYKVHASNAEHVVRNTSVYILNALQLWETCIMKDKGKTNCSLFFHLEIIILLKTGSFWESKKKTNVGVRK